MMFFEMRLMLLRKRQQDNLRKKNREAFDTIRLYMDTSSLVFFEREEVLQQILDTMLQAQSEGKDINLFLGRDHKEFCDAIIREYSTAKSFVLRIISRIEELIVYTMLGILLSMLLNRSPVFEINIIISLTGFLLILNPMSRKSRQEKIYPEKKYSIRKKVPSRGIISFILFMAYGVIVGKIFSYIEKKQEVNILGAQISIFSVRHLLIFGILFVALSEIYKSICNKQRIA
jgi:DNA-binding ferritin-like protein (Dps family)